MAKKNKNKSGTVYSTNPDYEYDYESGQDEDTLDPSDQHLKVMIDRKQRKGKEVTLIVGFVGTEDDLKDLGKTLKQKCGVGGSTKDGEIIVQGNQIKKVMEYLEAVGYNVKRSGGN